MVFRVLWDVCGTELAVLFFFYGSGDHRDLHSFPTRRSSDLAAVKSASVATASVSVTDESCAFARLVRTRRHLVRLAQLKSMPARSSPERSIPVKSAGC